MRIAFLMDAFPRLSETFILDQITDLIDRGHELEICTPVKGHPVSRTCPGESHA